MQLVAVAINKPEATKFTLGQTDFITSVEDLREALVTCIPGIHPPPVTGSPSGCAPSSAHLPPTYRRTK